MVDFLGDVVLALNRSWRAEYDEKSRAIQRGDYRTGQIRIGRQRFSVSKHRVDALWNEIASPIPGSRLIDDSRHWMRTHAPGSIAVLNATVNFFTRHTEWMPTVPQEKNDQGLATRRVVMGEAGNNNPGHGWR